MTEEITLKVTGMTCGGCESAVRRRLSTVNGVADAMASHRDEKVVVKFDPQLADRAKIVDAIRDAGFTVQL